MAVYGTVQGLENYAALTGRVLPVGANLEAALYMATMYIDGAYYDSFCGEPATEENAFPRKGKTMVPLKVEQATYEAAMVYLNNPDGLSSGGSNAEKIARAKVDVIEVTYAATDGAFVEDTIPKYSIIEGLLKPYLCDGSKGFGAAAFTV